MEDLEKSIKGLQNTLDRAKKLVNRIMNENSDWISLGVNNEDVKNAIEFLNVKHLDAHLMLFENHCLRIKKRLDTILLVS
jgi:hypothetical protein